jgi:hypothetical protein
MTEVVSRGESPFGAYHAPVSPYATECWCARQKQRSARANKTAIRTARVSERSLRRAAETEAAMSG